MLSSAPGILPLRSIAWQSAIDDSNNYFALPMLQLGVFAGNGREDRGFAGRRHRRRSRARMRQGHEGGGLPFRTDHRLVSIADWTSRAREAWRHDAACDRTGFT